MNRHCFPTICSIDHNMSEVVAPDDEMLESSSPAVTLRRQQHSTPERRNKRGSPVSVLNLKESPPESKNLNPVVIVGEDGGTEVTLQQQPSYTRDVAALLDSDISPTSEATTRCSMDFEEASPQTVEGRLSHEDYLPTFSPQAPETPKSPVGSRMCCGVGSWSTDEVERQLAIPTTQASIEELICGLLGNADLCGTDGWQLFVLPQPGDTPHKQQEVRQVLKNRAWDMSSKSKRIKALQDNLDPFGNERVEIVKKSSFCNAHHAATKQRRVKEEEEDSLQYDLPPTMSSMWAFCSSEPKEESPAVVRMRHHDDDLCYDSDPEDITRRHTSKRREPPRKTFLQPKRLNFDFHDNVKEQVKAMMNQRMTLIWHRAGAGRKDTSPLAVKAWIEHGHRLRSTLIQPKLMWKPVNEAVERSSLGISSEGLASLDLLDFLRILEADRTDTRRFALAKRSHSFVIESHDGFLLFETCSKEERDRIVHGLKLVVARLGSKVVAGEHDVFDEFFGFVPVGGLE